MNIGWPEGILLSLLAISFAVHCQKAGEPRTYNPVANVLDAIVLLALLQWGGFFA
jgi:hypothetical protein